MAWKVKEECCVEKCYDLIFVLRVTLVSIA